MFALINRFFTCPTFCDVISHKENEKITSLFSRAEVGKLNLGAVFVNKFYWNTVALIYLSLMAAFLPWGDSLVLVIEKGRLQSLKYLLCPSYIAVLSTLLKGNGGQKGPFKKNALKTCFC